jgi:hypothetical protein
MLALLLVIPDAFSSLFGSLVSNLVAIVGVYAFGCFLLLVFGGERLVATVNRSVMRAVGMLLGGLIVGAANLVVFLLGKGVPALVALTLLAPRRVKVKDPTSSPLVKRVKIDPANMPDLGMVCHSYHATPAGVVNGVHKVTIGQSGSAKNQSDINYEIQHQLKCSLEHLVILDPKANAPLTQIAKAYGDANFSWRTLLTGDRLFIYTFHADDPVCSGLRLYADADRLSDVAYMLCDEPNAKDAHWNDKAAELIEAVAKTLAELQAETARGVAKITENYYEERVTASLVEVRDVIADREQLEELKRISPLVRNVADNEKEWGYIRSTASRRLKPLSSPTVRRIFGAEEDTEQPDFSRNGGRDIVIIRPDPKSAKRLARYVHAVLDVIYRAAAAGGDAGGPGTTIIIDEAASYMRLDNLAEYLDIGRESLVQITYVLQSLKQLTAKLGAAEAEQIITSTEIKVVGATSDTQTAAFISRLSGRQRVEYRGPRQDDQLLASWRETERATVTEDEILRQEAGEWTIQQGPKLKKVAVPEEHYHYRQAAEPQQWEISGVVEGDFRAPRLGVADPQDDGMDADDQEDEDDLFD